MVNIRVILIKNANIFTTYETLFHYVIKLYRQFTKIALKCLEKIGTVLFIHKKWQVTSTIEKLFDLIFGGIV